MNAQTRQVERFSKEVNLLFECYEREKVVDALLDGELQVLKGILTQQSGNRSRGGNQIQAMASRLGIAPCLRLEIRTQFASADAFSEDKGLAVCSLECLLRLALLQYHPRA